MLVITPGLCPSWQIFCYTVYYLLSKKNANFFQVKKPVEQICLSLSWAKVPLSPHVFQLRNSNTSHEEVIHPPAAFFTLVQCCPSLYLQQAPVTPAVPVYLPPILKSLEVTLQRSICSYAQCFIDICLVVCAADFMLCDLLPRITCWSLSRTGVTRHDYTSRCETFPGPWRAEANLPSSYTALPCN